MSVSQLNVGIKTWACMLAPPVPSYQGLCVIDWGFIWKRNSASNQSTSPTVSHNAMCLKLGLKSLYSQGEPMDVLDVPLMHPWSNLQNSQQSNPHFNPYSPIALLLFCPVQTWLYIQTNMAAAMVRFHLLDQHSSPKRNYVWKNVWITSASGKPVSKELQVKSSLSPCGNLRSGVYQRLS